MRHYRGFGRSIRSDVAIPGAIPADGGGHGGIAVRLLAPAPLPPAPSASWERDADGLTFAVPGLGRFHCRAGEIAITPCPGADERRMQAVLVATMIPALLWLEGAFLLHAGAVTFDGGERTIAIAGPSGIGKSTVMAQLVDAGAGLAADDSLCLSFDAGGLAAHGLPGGLFLGGVGDERDFRPAHNTASGGRLTAIVVLARGGEDWAMAPLSPLAAVEQLLANRHRPQVSAILGTVPQTVEACAKIAACTPVHSWRRPEGAVTLHPDEIDALRRIA